MVPCCAADGLLHARTGDLVGNRELPTLLPSDIRGRPASDRPGALLSMGFSLPSIWQEKTKETCRYKGGC